MSKDDLDLLVAPYGTTNMKVGDTDVRVRRVLLRGQQRIVRSAIVGATTVASKVQELLGNIPEGISDDEIAALTAKVELVQDEYAQKLIDGIRAMIVGDLPFLDEMDIESLAAAFNAIREVQQRAFTESMVNSFPPSGG